MRFRKKLNGKQKKEQFCLKANPQAIKNFNEHFRMVLRSYEDTASPKHVALNEAFRQAAGSSLNKKEPGTLGERAGFQTGDRILSINGEQIADLVDFQVHSSDPVLCFDVERGGETYDLEVSRMPGESVGLGFEEMELRRCNNKCVFCFLHQMPRGMRRSLYVEDDDYRLSFLHGSYVTLTNIQDRDLERIIEQRLSPQYVSVHATDPQVRQALLGRQKPTVPILEQVELLARNHIEIHAQVVLCPGWNDGAHLDRTVADLSRFYPSVRSVALVPVGLTRFRGHLPQLEPVTAARAREYLEQAERWGERLAETGGERFAYAADELFLISGVPLPERSYYDAFPQIENGIGMARVFLDAWERGRGQLCTPLARPIHLALVTGELAARFLRPIAAQLSELPGIRADVVCVPNDYFGRGITVSGLLTGEDMSAALRAGTWDVAILPPNCISADGLTLDDMTLSNLAQECGVPLTVGGYDLAHTLQRYLADQRISTVGAGQQLVEVEFSDGDPL